MDLIGYLRLLRRRWWIITLAVLISVGAAVGATSLQHKRYETSARLLVSGSSSLSAVDEITRRQLAQQRAVLFSQLATTSPVIVAAERAADASGTAAVENTNPSVGASASGTDPFLTITVSANTPEAAQAIANQFVNVLPPELAKLDQLPSAVKALLTVVNAAGLPSTPSAPKPERNILIGLALGLVLGIAAALIRETLDTTLRDSEEVRRISPATILGVIPREFDDERLPAATRPHSRRSEAYRQVRTNLEFAAEDEQPPNSFVVTSAGQGEGKSTTVGNLALLVSRAGKRVAVVDADLRKPTLASLFNATSEYGLSDVLTERRTLEDAMQHVAGEQIAVLASGPNVARPSELLSSPKMEHILQTLIAQFDLVIVDSPPVLAITDALLVGKHTDGMVVVTRMRRTTRSGLRKSLEAVERVHARLLGVVVNAATESEDKRYGYTRGYAKGYLSDELSPDSYLTPARSSEPLPSAGPAEREVETDSALALLFEQRLTDEADLAEEPAPPIAEEEAPPPPVVAEQELAPPPVVDEQPPPVVEELPPPPPPVVEEEPAPPAVDEDELAPAVVEEDELAPAVVEEALAPPAVEEEQPPPPPAVAEEPPQVPVYEEELTDAAPFDEEPPAPVEEQSAPAEEEPPPPPFAPQVYLPPQPQVYVPPQQPSAPEPQIYQPPPPPPPYGQLPQSYPPQQSYAPPQAYPPPPPPPAYPPPPPPAFAQPAASAPQHAMPEPAPVSWQPGDALEQPEPTFRPPNGPESGSAMGAGEPRSRSTGKRRRLRGSKRHAEDEVRQRGDAG